MGVAGWYLFGLMALMAAGQLLSWGSFVDALARFRVGPAPPLAVTLVALELLTVAMLPFPETRLAGAVTGLAGALLWTGIAVVAFALRRRVLNCACFGRFLPQPLRWWVLVEDAAFVALAGWVLSRSA